MDRRHRSSSADNPDGRQDCGRGDRRERGERRRNAGLLELRARREGIDGERRGRAGGQLARRRLLALWRRVRG